MHSVFRAWPSRLLATVMTLVLLASYSMGACAHAVAHQACGHQCAGQRLAQAAPAAFTHGQADHALRHDASLTVSILAYQDGHTGGAGDGNEPGRARDCCDTICHGGQAVLAADAVVLHPPLSRPVIEPMAAFGGANPGGLDRPPKAFIPA
ncbi:MAG TPA: hypothetical protein VFY92_11705 [Hyphomicrobiaceae bacterium]|nr:hypothetical protein [Hyphomicrobiaceae bacterium]